MSARARQWFGFFIMLAGLILLSSPFLVGAYHEMNQKNVVAEFHRQEEAPRPTEAVQQTEPPTPTEVATVPTAETTEAPTVTVEAVTEAVTEAATEPVTEPAAEAPTLPYQEFYEAAAAYNAELIRNHQAAMTSLEALEYFALDSRKFGFQENIVGTIRIPRLEVELGLYLGANGDNMAKGAAIFGESSMPLGQPSENVAIAGHRGWNGTPMFRDIQKIQMGDAVYITTPWAELEYRVCAIEIVTPDNVTWCRIREGRTLVTLMTCHPYGQNYQRYIVYAELVPDRSPAAQSAVASILRTAAGIAARRDVKLAEQIVEQAEHIEAVLTEPTEEAVLEDTPISTPVTIVHADGTRETASVDATAIDPDGSEYGAVVSNVVILAENKMKPIACVMAVVVTLVGLWLTVQTIRDSRARKGERDHESE